MSYRQEMQKGIGLSTNLNQLLLGIGDVDDEVHHLLDGDDAVAVRVRQSQDLLRDAPANERERPFQNSAPFGRTYCVP